LATDEQGETRINIAWSAAAIKKFLPRSYTKRHEKKTLQANFLIFLCQLFPSSTVDFSLERMYILIMLKIETIKEIIEKHKQEISEKYYISEIGIFGSYTRGEQETESDIDILVSFNKPIGFIKFMRLEFYLSELLGKKVDLVTKDSLKPHIGAVILKETQYV
jgi:predicted nucleotidyltransferase